MNLNKNPAQFGIFFSANRLIGNTPARLSKQPDAGSPRGFPMIAIPVCVKMNFSIQPKDTPLRRASALFLFFLLLAPFSHTLRIVARLAGDDRTGVVSRSCSPASVTRSDLAMAGNLPTRAKKPRASVCPWLFCMIARPNVPRAPE